jgi:hypothetical protein
MKGVFLGGIVAAVLLGVVVAISSTGLFYTTGWRWYDSCWRRIHSAKSEPESPEQAIAWSKCDAIADSALYGVGYIAAGNPQFAVSPQLKAIQAACPNAYKEIAVGGWWINAIELIAGNGGPQLIDRFRPAGGMIIEAFRNRWPKCAEVRAAMDFPKMVRKQATWDWETPCKPCEAEDNAIQMTNKEEAEARAKWDSMSQAERDKEIDAELGELIKQGQGEKQGK